MKIDDREPDELKYKDWGFETQVERMKVADYIVGENIIGIERKEINDFVGSLEQRLWEQLINLEDNFDRSILIVHGTVGNLSHQNTEPRKIEGIYGAIARITASYDVNVMWVRGQSQFVKIVKKIHSKAGDERSAQKPHITKRNFRDDRVNILCGVYGVGYDTAKNLLEEHGSVRAIANCTREELAQASGVGGKTANKIYNILNDQGQESEENGLLG